MYYDDDEQCITGSSRNIFQAKCKPECESQYGLMLYQSTVQQCSQVKHASPGASPGEQSLLKSSFAYLFHCLVLVQTIAFQCHIQLLIIGNQSSSSVPVTSGISLPSQ